MTPSIHEETAGIWILPNRNQADEPDVVWVGHRGKLGDVVDIAKLPMQLVMGVPEELIQRYGSDAPIYSQFIRDGERVVFALSTCCGRDKEGRVVHLSYLRIGPVSGETILTWADEGLPTEAKTRAKETHKRLEQRNDRWACAVCKMLQVAKARQDIRSLANVEIKKAAFKVEWTPEGERRRRIWIGVILLAIVILGAVFSLFLYLRPDMHK